MSWEIPQDLWIFDCEVFKYDWLFVFKNKLTGMRVKIHNDPEALKNFIDSEPLLCGYNNKFYDNYIIKGILIGLDTIELKEVSDFIVNTDAKAWEHPYLQGARIKLRTFDIYDDMAIASLKSIEGHLGRNIKETSVDFNIDRPLTEEEIKLEFQYCNEDVDATDVIFDLRIDYLNTKVELGEMKGIIPEISLNCTNAKIVAKYMGAVRQEWTDGREYSFPKELDQSVIPKELLEFFKLTNDTSISDEELFQKELVIKIGKCVCKFKFGGAHGSYECYHAKSTSKRVIRNRDVGSLYPSLILYLNYLSRNVSDPTVFEETYHTRMNAKKGIGDIKKAKTLKLPLNTISGATDQSFSDLYDPHQARGMRYSGQLLIAELVIKLTSNIKSFELINLNTDGFAYEIDVEDLPLVDEICDEWSARTKLTLEEDLIDEIWIKDVNSLIIKMKDGKIKTVGSYVNYGISVKGQWAINNNYVIVKKALIDYLTKKIPIEETINNCKNILEFQLIAKVGSKFTRGFQRINNIEIPTQKVNRVYASQDLSLGTLYKVGGKKNTICKIAELPEHCIIDNENKLSINDIDKDWYIELAYKKLNDYLGISNKKPKTNKEEIMATKKEVPETMAQDYSTMNIFQKVQLVRTQLLQNIIKKNGVNSYMEYTYFELQDFLPILTPLMNEVGLAPVIKFNKEEATLTLHNSANINDEIVFTVPMPPVSALVSNTGKKAVSEVQALGMTMTYLRRYLYINAFDLIESDGVEEEAKTQGKRLQDKAPNEVKEKKNAPDAKGSSESKKATTLQPKGNMPLNSEERKEIVKELTKDNKPIIEKDLETLITELKSILKSILSLGKPELKSFVQKIILDTNKFTKLSIEEAEKYIGIAKEKLEASK